MSKLTLNYNSGDIIEICSPMVNHVHNEYCHCKTIVVLLNKHDDPNAVMKKIFPDSTILQKKIFFNPKTTWNVWSASKGTFKLTESWMKKLQTKP